MKQALLYLRVSSESQDYERQLNECTKKANADGYKIVKVYADKLSGKIFGSSRVELDSMLTFLRTSNIKQVYGWEISRVGRSSLESLQVIKELRNNGVNMHIILQGLDSINDDPAKQLQLEQLISFASYELALLKSRTLSGRKNSVRKGGLGSSKIRQYGYKAENGLLVIDEKEAAVVKDIFDKYLHRDWSVKKIVHYLNEERIPTKYKSLTESGVIKYNSDSKLLWTPIIVRDLMHKTILRGYRVYSDVEYHDEKLRIISDEDFTAVQEKLASARTREPNAKIFENIFRDKLKCKHCGSNLYMHKDKSGVQNHYKCYNRFIKKDKSCSASAINIDLLNNAIYNATKYFKVDSKDILEKIQMLEDKMQPTESINYSAKERLLDAYIDGRLSKENYDARFEKLDKAEKEIEARNELIKKANTKLKAEIEDLKTKKHVDLKNPDIFKSNIKDFIDAITVEKLSDEAIEKHNSGLDEFIKKAKESGIYDEKLEEGYLRKTNKRINFFELDIKMITINTTYKVIVNNQTSLDKIGNAIVVERV